MPSTSRSPLKSALPARVKVVAISTAPSISTTSKLVVPSTSISPEMSNSEPVKTPVTVKVPPMVALLVIGILPLASRKTAFSAGWVQNIVLVPLVQTTAELLLLDSKIAVLDKVLPELAYVPTPTSKSTPSVQQ